MPFLNLDENNRIYYEVHGEGNPVVFLHGIMMSTASWLSFIPQLSGKFRLILVDFRDQGRSSKMKDCYSLDIHVGDVIALIDHLQISQTHVMGLSYGGQVALRLARDHQKRIKSLCLFNTPGIITNRLLQIGKAWETAAGIGDGAKFFQLAVPYIYSESFYENHLDLLMDRQEYFAASLTKEWFDGFIRLSRSVEGCFLSSEEMKCIQLPTLAVAAACDSLVSDESMQAIYRNIPGCEFIMIPGAGHAAFLEKMNEFLTILMGFVSKHS
jgi:3-oxoadipate enol-lactonase